MIPKPRTSAALGGSLALVLLAACGGGSKPADSQAAPAAAEPAPTPAAAEEAAAPLDPARAVFSQACLDLKPLESKAGVKQPVAMVREYPELPGGVRVKGSVVLEAIVDTKGAVCDARVVRGINQRLDQACIDSLKRWAFTPARLRGDPVPTFFSVTIVFDTK